MRRVIYATVGCDACGSPDDRGVAIATEDRRGLLQICNPCLYDMWQESNRGIQFEKLQAEERAEEEAEEATEIDAPAARKTNYYGPDWQEVRRRILERDGGKCQGQFHSDRFNGGDPIRIVVHHRRPLREFGGDYNSANVPENLITLCTVCHGLAHADLNEQAKRAQQ